MYKVFIVDDEELVVKSLKASVDWTSFGFEVVGYALSGEEALAAIPHLQPDVIFSDIRMPGMSGLELMKHISDSGFSVKFIIVSGLAEFALAQKAIKQGVFGYCLKPFDEVEIGGYLSTIKRELDTRLQLTDGDLLDLIESGTVESHHALQNELRKAGIPQDAALKLMLTVGRDKMQVGSACLPLRIGYRKFVYILSEQDANELVTAMKPHISRGIGFSKPFADISGLAQAIQYAELQAYQYFTLASRSLRGPARVVPADEVNAHFARLDAMLPLFLSGQRDIRHALLLFNDTVSQVSRMGKETSDLFMYSYDHLVDRFEDVHDMIVYLKEVCREEKSDHALPMLSGRNPTFMAMLNYLHEHFCEDMTIQGMSTTFNINANYISQVFRKELDKTFTEYLTGLRMERAAALLRSTLVPINEVADQVGYQDYFYFSKLFKKTTGVSPKSYRSNHTEVPPHAGS